MKTNCVAAVAVFFFFVATLSAEDKVWFEKGKDGANVLNIATGNLEFAKNAVRECRIRNLAGPGKVRVFITANSKEKQSTPEEIIKSLIHIASEILGLAVDGKARLPFKLSDRIEALEKVAGIDPSDKSLSDAQRAKRLVWRHEIAGVIAKFAEMAMLEVIFK